MAIYPATIHHLYISPGHNYFGRKAERDGPGNHPTHDLEWVEAKAGRGLVGDRFFDAKPLYRQDTAFDGQVTFFAWEVYQVLAAAFPHAALTPAMLRRNVVIEGINLTQLIGQPFTLAWPDGTTIDFLGTKHCSPCRWMDHGATPGALQVLKGRGGLRAQILTDGLLRTGDVLLDTPVALDVATIVEPLGVSRLPK